MKKLKNCITLKSKVTVYMPSTVDVNVPIDNEKVVEEALALLSNCFGGATASEALGAWVDSAGNLVKEKVTLCFSFASQEDLNQHIETIYDYCLNLKLRLKQEAIALEVNGELHLI